MDDERTRPLPRAPLGDEYHDRVNSAFDDLDAKLGDRATPEARASFANLRAATLEKNAARLREHLDEVKQKHGWLWEELAAHPRVAALVNEFALIGL